MNNEDLRLWHSKQSWSSERKTVMVCAICMIAIVVTVIALKALGVSYE